jgi:hypothetical protein
MTEDKQAHLKIAWSVERISGLKEESDRRFGHRHHLLKLGGLVVVTDRVQVDIQILKSFGFVFFCENLLFMLLLCFI